MLEHALVEHCAPTLARLKLGGLFNACVPRDGMEREMASINALLASKGVVLTLLRRDGNRALFYLYRKAQLLSALETAEIADFLRTYGYTDFTVAGVIAHLRARLSMQREFPHEIGIFLGYPLADVIGFIENQGKNCVCCGYWKAYSDPRAAQKKFAMFTKCKRVYKRMFQSGRTLQQLTVAA